MQQANFKIDVQDVEKDFEGCSKGKQCIQTIAPRSDGPTQAKLYKSPTT